MLSIQERPSPSGKPNHTHYRAHKAHSPFTFRPSRQYRNRTMVFTSNPLSLNVPEEAFESWLRDNGYLEVLDQKTTELHRLNTSSSYAPAAATRQRPPFTSSNSPLTTDSAISVNPTTTLTAIVYALIMSTVSSLATLFSLFTLNPFSKLTADDFSGHTPAWTTNFIGSLESYSFPSSPAQAKMRIHENVKRFARNYATLFILFFACTLYQMPLALVGLLSCLALWECFRFCDHRWFLDHRPIIQQIIIRCSQCASAVILLFCNVQTALLCAFGVSYAVMPVMILHASFHKLTPAKHPPPRGRTR